MPVGDKLKVRTEDGRIVCPKCGRKTTQRVLPGTVMLRVPIYCKHCKSEAIVNIAQEPVPIRASADQP